MKKLGIVKYGYAKRLSKGMNHNNAFIRYLIACGNGGTFINFGGKGISQGVDISPDLSMFFCVEGIFEPIEKIQGKVSPKYLKEYLPPGKIIRNWIFAVLRAEKVLLAAQPVYGNLANSPIDNESGYYSWLNPEYSIHNFLDDMQELVPFETVKVPASKLWDDI